MGFRKKNKDEALEIKQEFRKKKPHTAFKGGKPSEVVGQGLLSGGFVGVGKTRDKVSKGV